MKINPNHSLVALPIRAELAARAMQGMLSQYDFSNYCFKSGNAHLLLAEKAVIMADALIAELNK